MSREEADPLEETGWKEEVNPRKKTHAEKSKSDVEKPVRWNRTDGR